MGVNINKTIKDQTKQSPKGLATIWIMVIILAILLVFSLLFFGCMAFLYYSSKNSEEGSSEITPTATISPTTTPTSTQTSSQQKSQQLLDKFYSAMKTQDAEATMILFTNPSTVDEQEEYDFMMGKDSSPPITRLYATASLGNFEYQSYKIIDTKELSSDEIKVTVSETRKFYDNTTGEWTNPSSKAKIFILKNVSGQWKIDQYYNEGNKGKYDGFY